MLKKITITSTLIIISASLVACGGDNQDEAKKVTVTKTDKQVTTANKRWYTTTQLMRGRKVFKENCAVCHGENAQGLAQDWKKQLPNGTYPAPPLNGTAHAWHHSKDALLRTINMGGIPLGGTMPSFKDKLSDKDKEAALAFISSLWSDEIYKAWSSRNK